MSLFYCSRFATQGDSNGHSLRTYLCKPCNGLYTYSFVVSKFLEENWFRFLEDCEILLNTKLIKPNDLLTILNQVNPNLQFTMERSATNLPFLDIMKKKTGTKIWMDIYNKLTDSKRYVPFTSNYPRS